MFGNCQGWKRLNPRVFALLYVTVRGLPTARWAWLLLINLNRMLSLHCFRLLVFNCWKEKTSK